MIFTPGVNILRGVNEASKSTRFEAIAYALFGAPALRGTLAEAVTYGQKDSTLRVTLNFSLGGVDYIITRSKSGAEIRTLNELLATGQTEVRKYVETLIGATADTASNLMLAGQQSIRGALDPSKAGAAISLIEKLANFSLIDKIVLRAQATLPSGATTVVKARLATLEGQLAQPLVDDSLDLSMEVDGADHDVKLATEVQGLKKSAWDSAQGPVKLAEQRNALRVSLELQMRTWRSTVSATQANFLGITLTPGPSETEIEELRKQVADHGRTHKALLAQQALNKLPSLDDIGCWDGDMAGLLAEKGKWAGEVHSQRLIISEQSQLLAGLQATLITETHCGLCGKDLAAVPEVSKKNKQTQAEIDTKTVIVQKASGLLEEATSNVTMLEQVLTYNILFSREYSAAAEFIELDEATVPARYTWTGPEAGVPVSDPGAKLRDAVAKNSAYQRDVGRKDQAALAQVAAQTAFAASEVAFEASQATLDEDRTTLERAAGVTAALFAADQTLAQARQTALAARQQLSQAQAVLRERQSARDALAAQAAQAQAELASMDFNNALIHRLREVRPEIADELWGMVLTAVSTDFSNIRGVQSVVTRSDNAFKVDGQGIGGLSGSTLDSLGLAIRKSLTKVFLPHTSFMMLDEPAAACDPEREAAMLGLIATSEFEQVLLITHSDLADSFAANVVRLG